MARKKKAKATPTHGTRKLTTVTHELPVPLKDEELLAYGTKLAEYVQDIAEEDTRQKSVRAELKAKLERLEASRSELAAKIARREEDRPIEVDTILDYDNLECREVRTDTGEIRKRREMTDSERQMEFDV